MRALTLHPDELPRHPDLVGLVLSAPRVHLAILVEPFLGYILDGRKTIESRFAKDRRAPYQQAGPGDALLLKRSGGPIVAVAIVGEVEFVDIGRDGWARPLALAAELCVDEVFFAAVAERRYASLLHVASVHPVEPIEVRKTDQRAWVVLDGPIAPAGWCPVQAHGPISDGLIYYFRARGEAWSFDVGPPDPSMPDYVHEPIWSAWGEWGREDYHAGYMPEAAAIAIIRGCLRSYRAGEPSGQQHPDHAHMPEGWAP